MALTKERLRFAWPINAVNIVDATLTSLGTLTAYIPQNVSRTITSAVVTVYFQDIITATGGTIGEIRAALVVNGAAANTVTELDDLTNSGENIAGGWGPIDFTSYVNTNIGTGASATFQLSVYIDQTTGTTLGMRNVWAEIELMVQSDASSTVRAKTLEIPLESLVGALTTTPNSQIGTNQIPQLTGVGGWFENVADFTIRDYFIVVEGNQNNNAGVTAFALSWAIDSGTNTFGQVIATLASDCFQKYVISLKASIPATTAAHQFQLWSSLAARFCNVSITIVLTYEYNRVGSTEAVNMLRFPMEFQTPLGGTTTANSHRFKREFLVAEPNPSLLRAACRFQYNTGASATIQFRGGAQAYRAYAQTSSVVCGAFTFQHRLDSGAAGGIGIPFAKGFNSIVLDSYRSVGSCYNASGLVTIVYKSSISSQGYHGNECDHVREIATLNRAMDWLVTGDTNVTDSVTVPETDFYFAGIGMHILFWMQSAAATLNLFVRYLTGEGPGDGWTPTYTDPYVADAELAFGEIYVRMRSEFQRFAGDQDTDRMNLQTARLYRYCSTTTYRFGALFRVAYHTIYRTISVSVTGYSGDGSGMEVKIFREDTREWLKTVTTTIGGTATFTWYDDVTPIYGLCYVDGTKKGRSDNITSSTMAISLDPLATATFPVENDVRDNVNYGPTGAEYNGDLVLPVIADVKSGITYGADGTEYTGTYEGGGGGTGVSRGRVVN